MADAAEEKGMDSWDPRQDDFECQKFNTYDRGPGQFLPNKIERSKADGIQLYISGIPNDLTEDGLYNLFSQAGNCLRSKKCVSKNPDAGDTYGFITMESVADADTALAKFNNFNIGRFRMRVRIAMSEEEMKKRKDKKLEEEEFIKSLPSQQPKPTKAVVTSSDSTDSSSGAKQNVNGMTKGKKKGKKETSKKEMRKKEMSNGHAVDKASAQQYPMLSGPHPNSPHVSGGYPYDSGANAFGMASRGLGLLGDSPNIPYSPYPPQPSYSPHSPGIVGTRPYYRGNYGGMSHKWGTTVYGKQENELQSADPAVLLCQKCPTLNERFNIIENFVQGQESGQGRGGYYGEPRRGRGFQRHFPNPYYGPYPEDYQYQGGYGRGCGRGYPPGPSHSYHPRGNYRGPGQGHFTKKQHMGYGRGQPYIPHENFRGARRGGYHQGFQGPFHVPSDCLPPTHHGSMESLHPMSAPTQHKQKIETRPCALCNKPGNFQCSRCKTSYCSTECQRAHWDDHRGRCKEIRNLQKKMEQEDEEFGDIIIGEDIIQKMVAGGALEKLELKDVTEVKATTEVKAMTQVAMPKETNGSAGKQLKAEKQTPPKPEKSSGATAAVVKPPTTKASPPPKQETDKHSSSKAHSMAVTNMVPLQVQRRTTDTTREPVVKTPSSPLVPKQARGKSLKISELPIGSDIQVLVTEVIDPHKIWLQQPVEENLQALTLMMEEMKTFYNQTNDHVACPVIGDAYAAQYSQDENWYRAKVDTLEGTDAVTVTYLDYGNRETVALTKLRQLEESMVTLPALAVKCSLADVSPRTEGWGEAVDVLLSLIPPTMASMVVYSVKVHFKQADCYTVDMLDRNGEDVRGKLVKAGVVKVPSGSTQASEAVSSPLLPYSSLPLNETVRILAMDVSSPDEIWVQEGNKEKIVHGLDITENLQIMINKQQLSSVTDVRLGEMYAAYSAKDVGWYRARVDTLREDGTINVTYVEFGNKENVSISQMKELDSAMKSEPLTAVHMVLDGIAPLPGEATWSDAAIATLKEFLLLSEVAPEVIYTAEAVGRTASYTSVRVTDDQGSDIAEKLVEAGVVRKVVANASSNTPAPPKQESAAPEMEIKRISVMAKALGSVADCLKPNEMVAIMITDATSPVDFVIQLNLEKLIRPFAAFSSELNNAMQTIPVGYKPQQVGELVLGQYEGVWYRAEVISLTDKEAHVCYIDFGNSEMKDFSLLSAAFESCDKLPAQSVRCSLYGVTAPKLWPQDILRSFAELTESPLEAEFKCMVDNVAMIDIKFGKEMMSVSSEIQHELERQKPGAKPQVSTVPKVEDTSVSAPTVQAAVPEVRPIAVTDTGPIMASNVSMETLPCTIEEAVISSIVDFESFYIQLVKLERKLAEIQESVSVYCASATGPYVPVRGELVCAKFSLDDQWYRAKVVDVLDDGQFNTQFVDYGNCDEVGADSIRKLTPSLKSLPCQSIHCKLHNVTNEGQTLETLQAFAQILGGCKVQVEARSVDGGVFSILLTTADGDDVNSLFKVKDAPTHQLSPHPEEQRTGNIKLSEIAKIEPKEEHFEVMITYAVSPEEIYCQLASQENIQALAMLLHNIMLTCDLGNNNAGAFRPEVGDLCCARFTDDQWYRAAVKTVFQDNTLLVHFIDFGNTEIVPRDKIRPILPEYTELPVPAFKCALPGLIPLDTTWSKEASDKLNTFCNERLQIQILEKVGDLYMVELSAGNNKVSDHLVAAGFARRAPNEAGDSANAASIKEQIAALQAQLMAMNKK